MAYREVADSSSGSGFPMNDGVARAPSNSSAIASYEDKPSPRKAFEIEGTNTMQRKRENIGGQEIPGATMNKMTRTGLPSPQTVPGYLAVGGPAFPRTARASVERNEEVARNPLWELLGRQYHTSGSEIASTDIWGYSETYDRLRIQRNRDEHIARCVMRPQDLRPAPGLARSALGAPSRWETSERQPHGGVSVAEFKEYLIKTAETHALSQGQTFGGQQIGTDGTPRDPWGYSFVPSQPQPIGACRVRRDAGVSALFNPWGSLNQDAMVRRSPPLHSARDTAGRAPSNLWAPLNLDVNYVSVGPIVTPPLDNDDAQRRIVGSKPLASDKAEKVPDQTAPKKPLVLLTPDDFLTLSNTDISSMLGRAKSNKSVKSDNSSDKTDDEVRDDSEEGSLSESDQPKDDSESDRKGSDEDEEYIHPMQVISDSIDKVDSWLQKHSDVLSSGVAAAARVVEEPLFEMPADDEVVERCQDIKRREFESTLDLARRKLRANSIKFERVAARFEKLYNEHLLEKCWLDELEAMKGRMRVEPPELNKTKRNEAPAPADTNAPRK